MSLLLHRTGDVEVRQLQLQVIIVTRHSSIYQLMSKRRRGNRQTHYQVPSLQALAAQVVRRTPHGYSQASHGLRRSLFGMDSDMSESRSTGTQTGGKRARTDASDGAQEAGQGLQVTVPRSVPHCYNNNYTVRLTYCDTYLEEVSYANSAAIQVWRMNSIFDPDFTGVGHQPLFRDMWASQYDFYTVLACEYEIHAYNGAVGTNTYSSNTRPNRLGCAIMSLLPSTNTNDYVTTQTPYPIVEMKNVVTKFMPPEEHLIFKGTLTPGDFIVDAKDADSDNTWVAVGSNPNVPRFLGYIINPALNANPGSIDAVPTMSITTMVKLNYTVQFTQVNQSLRSVPS